MSVKSKVNFVVKLEKTFPVQDLRANCFYIWPLIRHLFIIPKIKKRKKIHAEHILHLLLGSIYSLGFGLWFLIIRKPRKLVITSREALSFFNGKYYDRFFHELMETNNPIVLSYRMRPLINRAYKGSVLEYNIPVVMFIRLLKPFIRVNWQNDRKFIDLIAAINESGFLLANHVTKKDLEDKIKYVHAAKIYWSVVLRLWKVMSIDMVSYYNYSYYGLIWAADELGIPTKDHQHGVQGPMHLAYGSFTAIPESGYEILPSSFACWNKHYTNAINTWSSGIAKHNAITEGHAWIKFFKATTPNHSIKDIVLFSAQPMSLENLFDQKAKAIIQKLSSKYNVLIRLHPSQFTMKAEIQNYINTLGIVATVTDGSFPLPKRLLESVLHITHFSSVIIEASLCGVQSIAIDERANSLYPDYVKSGELIILDDLQKIHKFELV